MIKRQYVLWIIIRYTGESSEFPLDYIFIIQIICHLIIFLFSILHCHKINFTLAKMSIKFVYIELN